MVSGQVGKVTELKHFNRVSRPVSHNWYDVGMDVVGHNSIHKHLPCVRPFVVKSAIGNHIDTLQVNYQNKHPCAALASSGAGALTIRSIVFPDMLNAMPISNTASGDE